MGALLSRRGDGAHHHAHTKEGGLSPEIRTFSGTTQTPSPAQLSRCAPQYERAEGHWK